MRKESSACNYTHVTCLLHTFTWAPHDVTSSFTPIYMCICGIAHLLVRHDRVRSMRMGFFVQRFLTGGKSLFIKRFAENIPRFRRAGLPFTSEET